VVGSVATANNAPASIQQENQIGMPGPGLRSISKDRWLFIFFIVIVFGQRVGDKSGSVQTVQRSLRRGFAVRSIIGAIQNWS
jgi:hypothetical protein